MTDKTLEPAGLEAARDILKAFSIYTIEDDDGIRLSTGGCTIAHYGEHTPEGVALLKLDAHCRALAQALSNSCNKSTSSDGSASVGVREEAFWRDDAFEKAAQIVERWFGEDASECAANIRALKSSLKVAAHDPA